MHVPATLISVSERNTQKEDKKVDLLRRRVPAGERRDEKGERSVKITKIHYKCVKLSNKNIQK